MSLRLRRPHGPVRGVVRTGSTAAGADIWRIDLAQVVSRYIAGTEANLRRILEAAEGGGAVLVFDEADGLFGRRTPTRGRVCADLRRRLDAHRAAAERSGCGADGCGISPQPIRAGGRARRPRPHPPRG
ncbi:AAA family ATPase [Coralloluteibacterium stylophorae]|nr:AAA family ATPase [Coralloluteibacterium stylophorae]